MFRSKVQIIWLGICLSACTVGPEYQRPEYKVPKNFAYAEAVKLNVDADLTDLNSHNWWTGFGDSQLNALVEQGLRENASIRESVAEVKLSELQLIKAYSLSAVQLDLNGSGAAADKHILSGGNTESQSMSGRVGLNAEVPVDVFGVAKRKVESAHASLESSRAELQGTIQSVSADIVRSYIRVRMYQQKLILLKSAIEAQEEIYDEVSARFLKGEGLEYDVRRAEISSEAFKAELHTINADLRAEQSKISVLVGQFPGDLEDRIWRPQSVPYFGVSLPSAVPLTYLRAQSDVMVSEANLKRAVAEIGVAEAALYPAFSLGADTGLISSWASGARLVDTLIFGIGAIVKQSLLSGGAKQADVEAAEAKADVALVRYENSLRTAYKDFDDKLSLVAASRQRIIHLSKIERSAKRAAILARELYQKGSVGFLSVSISQKAKYNAEIQLLLEQTNYANLIADIWEGLGDF